MSNKTDHTVSATELLSIIFMAIQSVQYEKELEAMQREAEAEKDKQQKLEDERRRKELANIVEAEVAKREAKQWLQGQLGEDVAAEIGRNSPDIAPRLQTMTMLSKHGKCTPEKKLRELERNVSVCEMAGRGLIAEYDPHYLKAKKWVQDNVVPEPRKPSMDELAGTVSHRHVKTRGVGMEL